MPAANPNIVFYVVKLIIGGIVTFLAILTMSKTRAIEWVMIVAGFLFDYAYLVYDLLLDLGIFAASNINDNQIPVISLIFVICSGICFITAFIFKLIKK